MKTLKKSLSVLLAVAVLFSMFAFTVSAQWGMGSEAGNAKYLGNEPVQIDIETEQTNIDPAVYKFTVSATCNKPSDLVDLRIYYDKSVWKVIGKNGTANSTANPKSYNLLGQLADDRSYEIEVATEVPEKYRDNFTEEYISGAGTGNFQYIIKDVDSSQFGTLDTNKYGCVVFQWMQNYSDESLDLLCEEKQQLFNFYMQVLPDVELTPENSEVGQFEGGKEWIYQYIENDNANSRQVDAPVETAYMTIKNAVPGAAAETKGPKVEREKGQIKMTPTGDGTVEKDFQFRVLSKISNADWDTYLSNTGKSEDNSCLTKLGFVAYKGTGDFDMAQAQAAAKTGKTQGNYYVATTNYVKHADGEDAQFAACIKTSEDTCADATYIAFIQYKDADGTEQYAFYDAEYTALIKTHYQSLVEQYLAQYGAKG